MSAPLKLLCTILMARQTAKVSEPCARRMVAIALTPEGRTLLVEYSAVHQRFIALLAQSCHH